MELTHLAGDLWRDSNDPTLRRVGGFSVLPPARLLPRKDVWQTFSGFGIGESLDPFVARDPFPIPDVPDREGYFGPRHFAYWASGLWDYFQIRGAPERLGRPLTPGQTVLDLGCASGRTMRHFALQHEGLNVIGADIKPRNIHWCRQFLPSSIRSFVNRPQPPLPLADASIDLVYAQSVFTHISHAETAWLSELARVLRPSGIAFLTIHSERLWGRMDQTQPIFNALSSCAHHPNHDLKIDMTIFHQPIPADKVVFYMDAEHRTCNVFHTDKYIRTVWGRYFDVLEIVDIADNIQAEVIVRRRA